MSGSNSGFSPVSPTQGHFPTTTSKSVPTLGTEYLRSSTHVSGPRLHDYDLPTSNNGLAQLRPGLVGIPNTKADDTDEATAPMSAPARGSVTPFVEEEEDSKRDKLSSPLEDSLSHSRSGSGSLPVSVASGSRSRSVSTSGEEDYEMTGYTEKSWRSFVGRRYSDDGVEEHGGAWRGFGRDEKRKNRVHEWDGMDMEMEMD